MFFGADHFFAGLDTLPDDMAIYDRIAGARVALVAGVGAAPNMLVMGTHVGTFEQIFQIYTTHIIATERQADPILDALKHGHAYVAFDFLGYVPNFMFYAQMGDRKVMMGDEVAMTPGLKLKVEMPADADKVVILGNGSEFASGDECFDLRVRADRPGRVSRRGVPRRPSVDLFEPDIRALNVTSRL